MENLLHKCKTAYSKRIINLNPRSAKERKMLILDDIEAAYKAFIENKKESLEDKSKIEGFYI